MKFLCALALLLLSVSLSAQTPVDVFKGTRKIGAVSEDTMYFSLAKGDQLVFDFESTTGRDLMEFEIFKYPQTSKFRKDNQVKMNAQKVAIEETGVYWIRMANRSATERNCKLHVWRIPASAATKNFKTTVGWKTVNDTLHTSSTEKYITHRDTAVINREAAMTVQGAQSRYGSKSQSPEFDLPGNTIAWSYYVGVNQQGQQAFQQATQKFSEANNESSIPGYGPLAALALTGKSYFAQPQTGQGITYSILDATNVALAQQQQPFKSIRSKKVMSDFSAMKELRGEKCYFYLYNDTDFSQEVMVKIAAVVVYEKWGERPVEKKQIIKQKIPVVQP
jgi:hypothetical protein